MKSIIFAILLFNIVNSMGTNTSHEIIIRSKTDVFINKTTGASFDKESFQRVFVVNLASDQLTTLIPLTGEKTVHTIISKKRIVDKVFNQNAIELVVVNESVNQEEIYLLIEKESGEGYKIFQEIKNTDIRLFFSEDSRCIH